MTSPHEGKVIAIQHQVQTLDFFFVKTNEFLKILVGRVRGASNTRSWDRRFPWDKPKVVPGLALALLCGTSGSHLTPLAHGKVQRRAALGIPSEVPIDRPQTPKHRYCYWLNPVQKKCISSAQTFNIPYLGIWVLSARRQRFFVFKARIK